jgi:predicted Zn finger-like uncharacterized protein
MTPVPSLTTRCAHCSTVFRVTAGQLQAHGGQVRCGRCLQVFDALADLAPEAALPEARDPQPQPSAMAPAASATAAMPEPAVPEVRNQPPDESAAPVAAEEPDMAPVPAQAETGQAAPAINPGDAAVELTDLPPDPRPAPVDAMPPEQPLQEPVDVAEAAPQAAGDVDADNPFVQPPAETPPPQRRRRLLATGSVLLAAALAGQALFFYRSEVAARHPLARQWLGEVCAAAGCTVSLPQRPQSILIEASDLQVADPANPNRIQLTATLRNHAGHAVGYPALDLVLTNVNDHTLARRIFLPAEYVEAGRDLQAGIAANAEMTVRLALDTGNLGAAGFRLAVLAAPR